MRERPPACARLLSRCCHGLKIEVNAPEAVAIAEYLRGLPPEELSATREQMTEEAAYARTLDANTRWREQVPCAFLEDTSGECLIYDVRPLTCRAHASMSLEQCEARRKRPRAPHSPSTSTWCPASIFGMAKAAITVACDETNLDPRSFELTNAVAVALNEPERRRTLGTRRSRLRRRRDPERRPRRRALPASPRARRLDRARALARAPTRALRTQRLQTRTSRRTEPATEALSPSPAGSA